MGSTAMGRLVWGVEIFVSWKIVDKQITSIEPFNGNLCSLSNHVVCDDLEVIFDDLEVWSSSDDDLKVILWWPQGHISSSDLQAVIYCIKLTE